MMDKINANTTNVILEKNSDAIQKVDYKNFAVNTSFGFSDINQTIINEDLNGLKSKIMQKQGELNNVQNILIIE